MTWLIIAAAVEAVALTVALALCKAAARGDRGMENRYDQ